MTNAERARTPIEKLRDLKGLYTVNKFNKPYCTEWLCVQLENIADEIEAQYMRLPVDKNGVPVKPGDTLYEGKREIPGSSVYGVDGELVYIWHYGSRPHITGVPADEFTHVKPMVSSRTCRDISADRSTQFYCSECECTVDVPILWGAVNYCPNCGAEVVQP